jgi:SAM-dependent methyltransferase
MSQYIGQELDIFARAVHWKTYYGRRLQQYLEGEVLEVGAGIGAVTPFLMRPDQKRWVCLEPDPALAARIATGFGGASVVETHVGMLAQLDAAQMFDAIVYIDVLEHIEDDSGEMRRAAGHLKPGGRVCVLAPAHNWLYTPFDKSVGHWRRYGKESLELVAKSAGLELVRIEYLDSAGLLASLGNKLLLQSADPRLKQILFWDQYLVPVSRLLDPLFGYRVGKSVLGVWQKRQGLSS